MWIWSIGFEPSGSAFSVRKLILAENLEGAVRVFIANVTLPTRFSVQDIFVTRGPKMENGLVLSNFLKIFGGRLTLEVQGRQCSEEARRQISRMLML